MYCAKCGTQIDDDSRFCRHCGFPQAPDLVGDAYIPPSLERSTLQPTTSPQFSGGLKAALIVIAFIIVIAIASPPNQTTSTSLDLAANSADAAAVAALDTSAAPTPPQDPWSYSTDEDKVRGGTTYFASTTSSNSIHQNPPYDAATTMDLMVRKSPAYGTDVILTISSGQFMCPSYEGCSGTVRFDNGEAQRISFNGPADNSSDTIFVVGAKSFIAKLKKSKRVIIEKTLYEAGNPQFEFNVERLKWDH